MSEEQFAEQVEQVSNDSSAALDLRNFGKNAIERGQGFEPMGPAQREIDAAQKEDAEVARIVQQMDESMVEPGTGVGEPIPIQYNKAGTQEAIDEKLSVTPERAAKDLAEYRRGLADVESALKDQELANEVDQAKAEAATSEQQQQQPPAEPVALDQQVPVPPGLQNDPLVAALQREPALLEAMNTLAWQTEQKIATSAQQAVQYGQALQQQYAQEVSAIATAAAASIYAAFPELNGLPVDQLPAAISVISKQDPNRGTQLRNHLQNVQLLTAKSQQAQAAQAQQYQAAQQQQFQAWSKMQDDAFDATLAKEPPQRQQALRQEAFSMLREYGLSDQEVAWNWNNNPLMRSSAGQRILADAAAYRLARSIRPAAVPAVRVVQPGPSGQRASEDSDFRDLSNKLTRSGSARDAANLLLARRSRSR